MKTQLVDPVDAAYGIIEDLLRDSKWPGGRVAPAEIEHEMWVVAESDDPQDWKDRCIAELATYRDDAIELWNR